MINVTIIRSINAVTRRFGNGDSIIVIAFITLDKNGDIYPDTGGKT
ncbi:MAG: hypothetical protein V3T17_12005 [Pseudomonadales bacterium]